MTQTQLSDREREVLQQMSQGKSNQEIAGELGISESTVKYHINNILSKLGVSDRTQAVLLAIKRGVAKL
jgi:DNA-binding NarL/FixJ family response regulator